MVVQDLWMKKGPNGKKVRSARWGQGSRWRVVVYHPVTNKPITEACPTEEQAKIRDAELRSELAKGRFVNPRDSQITVADYFESWRSHQLHGPRTADRTERDIRRHIVPVLGHLPIGRVRSSHIKHWVKDRSNGHLSPASLRTVYSSTLEPAFTAAVVDHVIGFSPCVDIRLPQLDPREYTIATPQQVWDLADALPRKFRAVPIVVAGTGLRAGETFGLELRDVVMLARRIHVRQQAVKDSGRPVYLAPPKTATSKRVVEMGDPVVDELALHLSRFPAEEFEIDDESQPGEIGLGADGERIVPRRQAQLVFTHYSGEPMTRPHWSDLWRPAVARVGLPAGFGLRDLRHFFATALIGSGASVKVVQRAMGHSTPTTTLNVYTGYWPEGDMAITSIMTATLGRSAKPGSYRNRG